MKNPEDTIGLLKFLIQFHLSFLPDENGDSVSYECLKGFPNAFKSFIED